MTTIYKIEAILIFLSNCSVVIIRPKIPVQTINVF